MLDRTRWGRPPTDGPVQTRLRLVRCVPYEIAQVGEPQAQVRSDELVVASDGVAGREVWKADGTGTTRLKDINPGSGSSDPRYFTTFWNGTEQVTVFRAYNGGLGGIVVWLRGESGDEYYYAHLDDWAPGLAVGDRLSAGQQLGYVGNTGNARYTVPHLHFEFHPGGGGAINPYPLVKGLCG